MDIKIQSVMDALIYVPVAPTLAIRIFSPSTVRRRRYSLQESPLYVKVSEYEFDDNDDGCCGNSLPCRVGEVWFSTQQAEDMINNFVKYQSSIDCLLVHCEMGRNRSPAVAMALNDLFHLGQDTDKWRIKYSQFNGFVYTRLMRVGKEMTYPRY